MDNMSPKVKTVRVALLEMGEQQLAVFRMAFKMHNTTNYQIVEPNDKPDMILIDIDNQRGILGWREQKETHPNIPVVVYSSREPSISAPYLPKPIKFDTLFPTLRSFMQGGGVYDAAKASTAPQSSLASGVTPTRKTTIRRFNPQRGVLGALKAASTLSHDTAVLVGGKPVLIVFPTIQRVLLTVGSDELEKLCQDDNLSVVCKTVPDNPQWKERAKVTIMSCLWQMAIWTAQGRLVYPMTPHTVFTMKRWPNLTRLAPLAESMRLSAFLTKTSVNLNILYKVMPLEMGDILNYIAATYVAGFLVTDEAVAAAASQKVQTAPTAAMNVSSDDVQDNQMSREAERLAGPSSEQPRGLLQRLMRKLTGGN